MSFHSLDPNSRRMDQACFTLLESLERNHRVFDPHMWLKFIGLGYAFVIGNTYGAKKGEPYARLGDLLEKHWIYPPGGAEGRAAANRAMGNS
jgi:hypothetical protein